MVAVPTTDAVASPFWVVLTAIDLDEGALADEEIVAVTMGPDLLREVDAGIHHPQARIGFAVRLVQVADQAPPTRYPRRGTREHISELLGREQAVVHDGAGAGDGDVPAFLGEHHEQGIRHADSRRGSARAAVVVPVHAHRIAGREAPETVERFAQSARSDRHGNVQLRTSGHPQPVAFQRGHAGEPPADPDREHRRFGRIRHRIPPLPHPEDATLPEFEADVTVGVPEAEQVATAQEHPLAAYRSADTFHATTLPGPGLWNRRMHASVSNPSGASPVHKHPLPKTKEIPAKTCIFARKWHESAGSPSF